MRGHRRAIALSGWTAAGKTTHGTLLAEMMQIPFFSASEVLRTLASAKHGVHDEWGDRWHPGVDTVRHEGDIDRQVDSLMLRRIQGNQHGVFDACFLPWLYDGDDVIRIWIDSDTESRVRKCYVSHLDNARIDLPDARETVRKKDDVTRDALLRTHHAAYEPDDRFDIVVSNTDLIPTATVAAAVRGVAIFSRLLEDCVNHALGVTLVRPMDRRVLYLR